VPPVGRTVSLLDVATGQLRQLAVGFFASWSQDGSEFTYKPTLLLRMGQWPAP
jgi:hypothetical protein